MIICLITISRAILTQSFFIHILHINIYISARLLCLVYFQSKKDLALIQCPSVYLGQCTNISFIQVTSEIHFCLIQFLEKSNSSSCKVIYISPCKALGKSLLQCCTCLLCIYSSTFAVTKYTEKPEIISENDLDTWSGNQWNIEVDSCVLRCYV